METIYTVVQEGRDLFVRYEMTLDGEPRKATGYWPVSLDRSVCAARLIGYRVKDDFYRGVFCVAPGIPEQDYWTLQNFTAVLINGGKTEAARIDYTDVFPPKVRAGIQTRWYRGEWQKLLKKGWVRA